MVKQVYKQRKNTPASKDKKFTYNVLRYTYVEGTNIRTIELEYLLCSYSFGVIIYQWY